uniref:Myosin motor domain-containing protein n=1 Tax=Alexandrium monilatum TaxID=311494 RepID=A0A7S4QYN3_9DINO
MLLLPPPPGPAGLAAWPAGRSPRQWPPPLLLPEEPRPPDAPWHGHGRRRQLFGRTVIQAFRSELDSLVQSFMREDTCCHYVRCVKPNLPLQPHTFDSQSVLRQCRYSGLLETVQIRQLGYPHRRPLSAFVERYAALAWPLGRAVGWGSRPRWSELPHEDLCVWASAILARADAGGSSGDALIGRTKVLMRSRAFARLEALRGEVQAGGVVIQAAARCRLARTRFRRMRAAAVWLQARVRGLLARRAAWRLRALAARTSAAVRIQRRFRRCRARAVGGRRGARPEPLRACAGAPGPPPRGAPPAVWGGRPPASRSASPRAGQRCASGGPRKTSTAALSASGEEPDRQHQVQMDAMRAQCDALREYRARLLRELAGARHAHPAAAVPTPLRAASSLHAGSRQTLPPHLPQPERVPHAVALFPRCGLPARPPSWRGGRPAGGPGAATPRRGPSPHRSSRPLLRPPSPRPACGCWVEAPPSPRQDPHAPLPLASQASRRSGQAAPGEEAAAAPAPALSAAGSRAATPRPRSPSRNRSPSEGRLEAGLDRHGGIVRELLSRCGKISEMQRKQSLLLLCGEPDQAPASMRMGHPAASSPGLPLPPPRTPRCGRTTTSGSPGAALGCRGAAPPSPRPPPPSTSPPPRAAAAAGRGPWPARWQEGPGGHTAALQASTPSLHSAAAVAAQRGRRLGRSASEAPTRSAA